MAIVPDEDKLVKILGSPDCMYILSFHNDR